MIELDLIDRRKLPLEMIEQEWKSPCGWSFRSFRLPANGPSKGEILFLGGRGDFFEKYLEAFTSWRLLGWNVCGFDWRGQGGSGRFRESPFCHIDDFATFVADLEAFSSTWKETTTGPHIAIGHSMGAHVLLRAVLQRRIAIDALVLLSPMLGIRVGPIRGTVLRSIAAIGLAPAFRERPIWHGSRSPAPGRVTSCPERHADKLWWKAMRPELGRGGPTWGWLAAATRSIGEVNSKLREQPLQIPGLLVAAVDDPIVDPIAIEQSAKLLPSFEYFTIPNAGHELLRERNGPRNDCMAYIDDFLERVVAAS